MASSAGPSTRSASPVAAEDSDLPNDYKPYVPVAKRRAQMLSKLGPGRPMSKKIKTTEEIEEEKGALRALDEANEREREKARQQRTLLQEAQEVKKKKEMEGELTQGRHWLTHSDANKTVADLQAEQEAALLAQVERAQKKLASVQELAHGKAYTESMKTSWRPPRYIRELGPEGQQAVRDKYSIIIEGEDPPPAIEHFGVGAGWRTR